MPDQGETDGQERSALATARVGGAAGRATPESGDRSIDVLFVCAGNVCRSPVAEAFLRQRLEGRRSDVVVHSAGLRSGGERADRVVVKMLRRRGIALRNFRSTTLTLGVLSRADLVLGIASDHVEAVLLMAPERWPRVFTLKELIRRSDAVGGPRPEEPVDDWLARLHSGRTLSELRRFHAQDDIRDPTGRSPAEYEEMVNEVEALTRTLAELIPAGRADSAPPHESVPADLGPEGIWSVEDAERLPPIAFDGTLTGGNGQAPPVEGKEADGGVRQGDGDVEETSMRADEVEAGERGTGPDLSLPDGPFEGLRTAQEALQGAQDTVTEAARQLAEVLQSATDSERAVPADAYTQLGDEVAAVMRTAAEQSSVVRDQAESFARGVRSQAEADALALREESDRKATEVRRRAEEESATMRREAGAAAETLTSRAAEQARLTLMDAEAETTALRAAAATERQEAISEAAALRRAVTTEVASLRDEADHYARSTRQRAEADAKHVSDEADRYAHRVQTAADTESRDVRERAENEAATLRHAAEEDARAMRCDAEQEAAELLGEASARYAELVAAEGELRSRLEGAAGALVSALEGRQHILSPPLALAGAEAEAGSDEEADAGADEEERS